MEPTLREALERAEREAEEARRALERLTPLPVRWRWVRCGREACRKCPHGPYPYLRVRETGADGRPRWKERYLGKDWQPPEGTVPPRVWRAAYKRYREAQERVDLLRDLLAREEG